MEGCIWGWETGEAAARIHRVMWLTGRRREEEESTMASQSTPEKSEDLNSGWDPMMVGGQWAVQREVLSKQLELRRETWAGDKLVRGATVECVGSLRVWLSSPRKVTGEPGGAQTLRRTLKGTEKQRGRRGRQEVSRSQEHGDL